MASAKVRSGCRLLLFALCSAALPSTPPALRALSVRELDWLSVAGGREGAGTAAPTTPSPPQPPLPLFGFTTSLAIPQVVPSERDADHGIQVDCQGSLLVWTEPSGQEISVGPILQCETWKASDPSSEARLKIQGPASSRLLGAAVIASLSEQHTCRFDDIDFECSVRPGTLGISVNMRRSSQKFLVSAPFVGFGPCGCSDIIKALHHSVQVAWTSLLDGDITTPGLIQTILEGTAGARPGLTPRRVINLHEEGSNEEEEDEEEEEEDEEEEEEEDDEGEAVRRVSLSSSEGGEMEGMEAEAESGGESTDSEESDSEEDSEDDMEVDGPLVGDRLDNMLYEASVEFGQTLEQTHRTERQRLYVRTGGPLLAMGFWQFFRTAADLESVLQLGGMVPSQLISLATSAMSSRRQENQFEDHLPSIENMTRDLPPPAAPAALLELQPPARWRRRTGRSTSAAPAAVVPVLWRQHPDWRQVVNASKAWAARP